MEKILYYAANSKTFLSLIADICLSYCYVDRIMRGDKLDESIDIPEKAAPVLELYSFIQKTDTKHSFHHREKSV
jgi:hypothetical protein